MASRCSAARSASPFAPTQFDKVFEFERDRQAASPKKHWTLTQASKSDAQRYRFEDCPTLGDFDGRMHTKIVRKFPIESASQPSKVQIKVLISVIPEHDRADHEKEKGYAIYSYKEKWIRQIEGGGGQGGPYDRKPRLVF